jgi:hypothetical protein
MPVVKEYHGDLYHDAMTIHERIEELAEDAPFCYVVRPSGTHLGLAAEYALAPSIWQRGSKAYIVTLTENDRQEWFARFDLIKQD